MDCQRLDRDQLTEKYLRGELDPAVQDAFETHILECAACLHTLEAYQGVWDKLAERAHEIRAQGPVRRSWLSWEFATVAAMAMALVMIGIKFVRPSHHDATATSHPQAQQASSPAKPAEPNGPTAIETPMQAVAATTQKQPDQKQPSQAKQDHKPEVGSVSPANQEVKTADTGVPPTPPMPSSADNKEIAPPDLTHLAEVYPLPKLTGSTPLSEEQSAELFRLGTVQAPPYTFSGFAASTKGSKEHADRSQKAGLGAAVSNPDAGMSHPGDPGRTHFQHAMDAYVEKRYGDAAEMLEQAVRIEPAAADAHFFLGVCRLLEGRPADSITPLKAALAIGESPFAQSAHFYLAKAYVQTGDLSQAEVELQSASSTPGRLTSSATSMLARLQLLRAQQKGQDPAKN